MRTNKIHVVLSAACLVAMAGMAHAARPMLPYGGDDQVPQRLAVVAAPSGTIERKPLSFSWALDPSADLHASEPFLARSREYWMTVDGTELQRGLALQTSAPGALIRVSPGKGAANLRAEDFSVSLGGRQVGIARIADDQALRQAGMAASSGTQVLRLGVDSGPGRTLLRAANARGSYVVHVFEPNSDRLLFARASRNHALAGDTMRVSIGGQSGAHGVAIAAEALLVAPDGSSQPVAVRNARSGGQVAVFTLPSRGTVDKGLWELQVFAQVDGVPRDARTAFAVALPTARFAGDYSADARSLRVTLPVEAASPGRYEARGTLYATAPGGDLRPVSEAHAAAWMRAGKGALVLAFQRAHLPAGYGAPFEVRDLELNDQGRMAPLESRERGLRF
jgi:hypothetical protein